MVLLRTVRKLPPVRYTAPPLALAALPVNTTPSSVVLVADPVSASPPPLPVTFPPLTVTPAMVRLAAVEERIPKTGAPVARATVSDDAPGPGAGSAPPGGRIARTQSSVRPYHVPRRPRRRYSRTRP